ncbi:Isoflavone 2'-hydroxylase [Apostasia shenzhenica]|uniref:Isoflavone 2'-hydroxylase n=1 Tax=Apostasia shenzhenica TaxID=1088818 RepID=A0A2I0APH5_9ASPA|nr:Isoflavone 2'-hydroxylase [Apostasia shenzhenica]
MGFEVTHTGEYIEVYLASVNIQADSTKVVDVLFLITLISIYKRTPEIKNYAFHEQTMEVTPFCAALALFLFLFHLIKKLLFDGETTSPEMSLPPTPPSLPVLGHLHHLRKPLHQSLARLSAAHGPLLLLRFGTRRVLCVSSRDIADECFTTNDLAFAGRPVIPSVRRTSYNYTAIAIATYGPDWRDMRRIATIEALSGHRLCFFSDVRADEARALVRILFRDTAGDGFSTVELRPRLFGLAMNVMMRMIIGKRYYGCEAGEAEARRIQQVVQEVISAAGVSNVGDFLPAAIGWIARLGVRRRLARAHRYRDRLIQGLIDEEKTKRREKEDAGEVEKEERPRRTVMDASLLTAGTDTSSNTIEWALSLLLNQPEKMEKARQELDEQIGHGRLLQESDLPNLPFLHCIINESLRLYPVAPLLVPHQSLEPCKLGGYDIPRGTMLIVNAYVIHRDPELWPEPAKFLPERFEGGKAEAERMKMLPFGRGRRKCPGEALALKEVGLVLGTLLQCFEWGRVGEDEVGMEEGSGLTMPRVHPLQAMCKPRECMISALSQI